MTLATFSAARLTRAAALAAAIALASPSVLAAEAPPAIPGVDAPALARLGPYAIGVAAVSLVQPDQPDPLRGAAAPERADRRLRTLVWYPAQAAAGEPITYRSALPGPDGAPARFTIPGAAHEGVPPAAGRYPLVILAHGMSNTPEVMSWLGENLASKGYVVVAPAFDDPAFGDRSKMAGPIARRPQDIAFVAREAARRAGLGEPPFASADPQRVALIGYSMGGYGVLTAAGAALDPALAPATRGVLAPFVAGGARAAELHVANVKAVVAISPPLQLGPLASWTPDGLAAVSAPTFLIVGSQDHLVGYDPGVRTVFERETHAPRYLLTFREAGHNIGMSGAPDAMQARLWDKDWFEDPVWRKSRLNAIEAHFITAFLDRYVKGEADKAHYIDGLTPDSDAGVWADPPAYGAVSPGPPVASLWPGFQPAHAAGMQLETRSPAP